MLCFLWCKSSKKKLPQTSDRIHIKSFGKFHSSHDYLQCSSTASIALRMGLKIEGARRILVFLHTMDCARNGKHNVVSYVDAVVTLESALIKSTFIFLLR